MIHTIVICIVHDMFRRVVVENLLFRFNDNVKISMTMVNLTIYVLLSLYYHHFHIPHLVGGCDSTLTPVWVVSVLAVLYIRGCMPVTISIDTTLMTMFLTYTVTTVSGCYLRIIPFKIYVHTISLSTASILLLEIWESTTHGTSCNRTRHTITSMWTLIRTVVFGCFCVLQSYTRYQCFTSCSLIWLVGIYQVYDTLYRFMSIVKGLHISVKISICRYKESGKCCVIY